MISKDVSITIVEHELEPTQKWAARKSIGLCWLREIMSLRVTLIQPNTNEKFYLLGMLDSYRILPPIWVFTSENWEGGKNKNDYPAPPKNSPYGSSIFHPNPVICAPFNRLAYREHNGPHGDWGGASNWLNTTGNHVRATTLGDMLQVIRRDLLLSKGRMN